ncbi:MAG: hypothetical protein ABIO05_09770 [Ferruginibacter sp.]
MADSNTQGKITFINHEKKYAIIEYLNSGKKKTVNANIDLAFQKKLKEQNLIKKTHHFLPGDVVTFKLKISERGERMMASNMQFLYNNAIDELIHQAGFNNKFTGYLKIADDKYFVKEIASYLFFPVPFSPWQILPTEKELNEPVTFSLENLQKKEKIFARLFNNEYIPEFTAALKYFKSKTPILAEVSNITAHGIYFNIINEKIKAKIDKTDEAFKKIDPGIKMGDKVELQISYLSILKIAVVPV